MFQQLATRYKYYAYNYKNVLNTYKLKQVMLYCDDETTECKKIFNHLKNKDLNAKVDGIYIAPIDVLINEFIGDENVEFRLKEENNIAMNRDGRQILVCSSHPAFKEYGLNKSQINEEILRSIYHEEAHLSGISDEERAEQYAQLRIP